MFISVTGFQDFPLPLPALSLLMSISLLYCTITEGKCESSVADVASLGSRDYFLHAAP